MANISLTLWSFVRHVTHTRTSAAGVEYNFSTFHPTSMGRVLRGCRHRCNRRHRLLSLPSSSSSSLNNTGDNQINYQLQIRTYPHAHVCASHISTGPVNFPNRMPTAALCASHVRRDPLCKTMELINFLTDLPHCRWLCQRMDPHSLDISPDERQQSARAVVELCAPLGLQ